MNEQDKQPDEIQPVLAKIARGVTEEIPPNYAFVIMVFPKGKVSAKMNYISNEPRKNVLEVLKQFLYRALSGDVKDKSDIIKGNRRN
jgi:hypothetical protein